MVMYFQDDFWEAVSELPRKERDAAVAAMVAYHFDGEEPSVKGAPKAVFIAVRERIEMSKTRQNSGKQNGSKTEANPQANAKQNGSKTEANPQANAKQNGSSLNREGDRDRGRALEPPLPPFDDEDDGFADFGKQCLKVFNAETGQAVAWLPEKAWLGLRRVFDAGMTVDDVRKVVAKKHGQWRDDPDMARFIAPNTLFGDKFAQYLEEGGGSDDLVAKYGG